MKEFKIGVIGFGFMGKTHSYGYLNMPLFYGDLPFKPILHAVATQNQKSAQAAKDALGFAYCTNDPIKVLTDPEIDIINICSPNLYHKDQIITALDSGKHVYCDKPLTVDIQEAEEVIKHIKPGTVHQVTFQNRFVPAVLKAKELIENGKIGDIISFRGAFRHSGSVDPKRPMGWKQEKRFGGGVLVDLGSHILDLLYYLMGEYEEIFAKTGILYPERPDRQGNIQKVEAEDYVLATVKMKNGAFGHVEVTKIATGAMDELSFEVNGTKGAVKFELMDTDHLKYYAMEDEDGIYGGERGFRAIDCLQKFPAPGGQFPAPKSTIGWLRGHAHCLYSFMDCVYNGKQASPSFYDALYIQKVMDSIYSSDINKQWTKV